MTVLTSLESPLIPESAVSIKLSDILIYKSSMAAGAYVQSPTPEIGDFPEPMLALIMRYHTVEDITTDAPAHEHVYMLGKDDVALFIIALMQAANDLVEMKTLSPKKESE